MCFKKKLKLWLWTPERLIKNFRSTQWSSLFCLCFFGFQQIGALRNKKSLEPFAVLGGPGDAPLELSRCVSNKRHPRIGPGGSFGELALLYFAPRAATVEVGVVSVGPVGFFWTGGEAGGCFGVSKYSPKRPSPKKRGVENSEVFGKALWKISDDILDILGVCWFLIELCVFVQDGSLAGSWWFLGLDHWSRQYLEMAMDRGSRDGHGSIFTDIHNIHP